MIALFFEMFFVALTSSCGLFLLRCLLLFYMAFPTNMQPFQHAWKWVAGTFKIEHTHIISVRRPKKSALHAPTNTPSTRTHSPTHCNSGP
jgi:hypothetical protein